MKELIANWVSMMLRPLARPRELLSWRMGVISDDVAYGVPDYNIVPLCEFTAAEINKHLDENSIKLARAAFQKNPDEHGAVVEVRTDAAAVRYPGRAGAP